LQGGKDKNRIISTKIKLPFIYTLEYTKYYQEPSQKVSLHNGSYIKQNIHPKEKPSKEIPAGKTGIQKN
jgi:hypothetical protein